MSTPRSLAALSALAILPCAMARAAEPRVPVRATDCGTLDANEVAILLELELEEQAGSWDELTGPPVELTCTPPTIRITVTDPITEKRLERSIPEPGPVARERAIALAVSQLFLTSWLELLLPHERRGPMPELPAPAVARAEAAARRAVPSAPAPAPEPPSDLDGALSLHAGVRARDLREPFSAVAAALRAGVELDGRWSLFAQAAFERGVADRARGSVETLLADFGVGAGYLAPLVGPLALDACAVLSALYVRLTGERASASVRPGRTESAAAQATIEAGPSLRLTPFRIGLSALVGVTLFAPEGAVSQEPAVRPGGAFLGAQLSVGAIL